jgi:hypothetical protein
MSNQSYLNMWCRDFSEEQALDAFGALLATVPFSATLPRFTFLTVHAVDASETPVLELDLRAVPLDAAGVIELARDHLHSDCSGEVNCYWDLFAFDGTTGTFKREPQPLAIFSHGEEYDNGWWTENGHLQVHLGFEHFFTGHAELLGNRRGARAVAESPEEARLLEAMAWPENLETYHQKTRENIRTLFDWVRRIEKDVPVERLRLWSEGEENFEARIEEILAVR